MNDYKIVQLSGGLGNQMFQYAFGRVLQEKLQCEVLYDATWFETSLKTIVQDGYDKQGMKIRPYKLDIFNLDIKFATEEQIKNAIGEVRKSKVPGVLRKLFHLDTWVSKKITRNKLRQMKKSPFERDLGIYYENFFLTEYEMKGYENIIKKDFTFPEIDKNDQYNLNIINKINNAENPVFVHLRRGDYLNFKQDIVLKDSYYQNAVKQICNKISNPTFFVFGQGCEEYIQNNFDMGYSFEYVGDGNSIQDKDYIDMQLMSMCKHGITANSTFSEWAGILCDNKDKIIIKPTEKILS